MRNKIGGSQVSHVKMKELCSIYKLIQTNRENLITPTETTDKAISLKVLNDPLKQLEP